MNWDAVGAIGELVSAVAVLATLIYLAIQVRHTKQELRRGFLQNRDNSIRELLLEPARNPELRAALVKARANAGAAPPALRAIMSAGGLNEEEATAILNLQIAWWFYRVETIANIDQLPASARADFDFNIHLNYSQGIARAFWEEWRRTRGENDPTVQYISRVLEAAKGKQGGPG